MDGLVVIFALLFFVAIYVFICYCYKQICVKCGEDPGILIWIPLLQLIPLFKVSGLPVWMIIGFLIPYVNIIFGIYFWIKISEKRGKGLGWGIITGILPIIGIPYLAFSE